MKHVLPTLLTISAIAAPAWAVDRGGPGPRAESKPLAISVFVSDVEGGKRTAGLEAMLTIAADHDCAEVSEKTGAGHVGIKLCRQGGDDSRPVLDLDLFRDRNDKSEQHIRTRVALALGKRVEIGRYGEEARSMLVVEMEAKASGG
ncbi:MAG: hypothetical protein U1E65_07235 [Myxococcota bacterium]